MERWVEITGFPQFEVNEFGRVRNTETGNELEGTISHAGTIQYTMRTSDRIQSVYAQNLVYDAFIGEPLLPTEHVIHIDGNKRNNHFTNLDAEKKGGRPRKW